MTQLNRLNPIFVEYMPEKIEDGNLYLSIEFATAVHNCCCGCGSQVVTPLSPTDWRMIFDGVSISLKPSIGNWSFACQSHYWVTRNNIEWTGQWSKQEIDSGRSADMASKEAYFERNGASELSLQNLEEPKKNIWNRILAWLGIK